MGCRPKNQDRRGFLRLVLAGAACSACKSAGVTPESFGDVSGGNTSSLRVGSLVALRTAPAVIARDAKGLYAMTTTCTHQGCDVGVSSGGLYCDCHGAQFDANGEVLSGPAPSPLQHFAVSVDAQGNITVHGGQEVDASARTAV